MENWVFRFRQRRYAAKLWNDIRNLQFLFLTMSCFTMFEIYSCKLAVEKLSNFVDKVYFYNRIFTSGVVSDFKVDFALLGLCTLTDHNIYNIDPTSIFSQNNLMAHKYNCYHNFFNLFLSLCRMVSG